MKLQVLKSKLRQYNNAAIDSRFVTKNDITSRLADIDIRMDSGDSNQNDVSDRISLLKQIGDIDRLEYVHMAQKVKVRWAVEGDENSKFFHGILKKSKQLVIRGILADGDWVDNLARVKEEFLYHFLSMFSKPIGPRPVIHQVFQKHLSTEQADSLEEFVTPKEIIKKGNLGL